LRYGRPYRELRVGGKKVDLHFKKDDFGREVRVFVEAKNYSRNLTRNDLVKIVTHYDGIIDQRTPDTVLVISRLYSRLSGLSGPITGLMRMSRL
jgi:hypothetical protein